MLGVSRVRRLEKSKGKTVVFTGNGKGSRINLGRARSLSCFYGSRGYFDKVKHNLSINHGSIK